MNYLQHKYNVFFERAGYEIILDRTEEPSPIPQISKDILKNFNYYADFQQLLTNRLVCRSWKIISDQTILDDLKLSINTLIKHFKLRSSQDRTGFSDVLIIPEVTDYLLECLRRLQSIIIHGKLKDYENAVFQVQNLLFILFSRLPNQMVTKIVDNNQSKEALPKILQSISSSFLYMEISIFETSDRLPGCRIDTIKKIITSCKEDRKIEKKV